MTPLSFLAPVLLSSTPTAVEPLGFDPFVMQPYVAAPAAARPLLEGGSSYFRINGGLVTTEDSDGPDEEVNFDEGFLIGLAFGRRLTSGERAINFDLELEGVWTDQDADSSGTIEGINDVNVIAPMLNGIADIGIGERFALYGGAGIGVAWMDVGTSSDALNDFDDEDGPFLAWQLKAGVSFQLSESTALLFGYRFFNVDDNEIDDSVGDAEFDLETSQHTLELGLRFGI